MLVNLFIDGFGYDVFDTATEIVYPKGEGLNCDGVTRYQLSDDSPYSGLIFILSSSLSLSDTANLYVANGSDVFEIRVDSDEVWVGEGDAIALEDSLDDGESTTVQVRANPHLDIVNSEAFPVEGYLEITAWEGDTQHITCIPLSAVVRDRIPSITVHANIMDQATLDVLETFGITEIVLEEAS